MGIEREGDFPVRVLQAKQAALTEQGFTPKLSQPRKGEKRPSRKDIGKDSTELS